jgi:predicted AlkP superfamily pyrophosphatase or phosphodiesterase
VYTNDEARSLGIPAQTDTDQAPQLYLTAAPGYAFGDETSGELLHTNPPRGQHGYPNTMPDMQALFVASGSAIKPGITLGSVSNLQVAPTIAQILGVQLPDAKQPILKEILR